MNAETLHRHTVAELKNIAISRGLNTTGRKNELINRILENVNFDEEEEQQLTRRGPFTETNLPGVQGEDLEEDEQVDDSAIANSDREEPERRIAGPVRGRPRNQNRLVRTEERRETQRPGQSSDNSDHVAELVSRMLDEHLGEFASVIRTDMKSFRTETQNQIQALSVELENSKKSVEKRAREIGEEGERKSKKAYLVPLVEDIERHYPSIRMRDITTERQYGCLTEAAKSLARGYYNPEELRSAVPFALKKIEDVAASLVAVEEMGSEASKRVMDRASGSFLEDYKKDLKKFREKIVIQEAVASGPRSGIVLSAKKICWGCNQEGHLRNACPSRKTSTSGSNGGSSKP